MGNFFSLYFYGPYEDWLLCVVWPDKTLCTRNQMSPANGMFHREKKHTINCNDNEYNVNSRSFSCSFFPLIYIYSWHFSFYNAHLKFHLEHKTPLALHVNSLCG